DLIFGGGYTNKSNTIAGLDLRFRITWLRNTEIYGEYSGEDSALFWPFLESYVAGFYIPRLTTSGKDDFRFEFFWGHPALYSDFHFPKGYTYYNMTPGHSQGGATIEFFTRYSHWFSPRNNFALEYFRTDRGHEGRVPVDAVGNYDPNGVMQSLERKNAVRVFWNLPLYGEWDANLMYGWEHIDNFNLVAGVEQTNLVMKVDLKYRY
ncbi:MAG TPA: capsule assembly Wzi family protein, partial [Geobacteraceae bacterium]